MEKRIQWKLEHWNINQLKPYDKNPRIITEQGLKHLENSFNEIGNAQPININTDGTILSGHARHKQLLKEGVIEVPVYVPDRQLTPKQEEAVIIRMNKNVAGDWDFDILANQFDIEDLKEWGFDDGEIPEIEVLEPEPDGDPDSVPEIKPDPVTKRGDVWLLGKHRLCCGDSTMIDDVDKLMKGEKADMVFTDPPYGMNYSGRGKNTSNKILNDNIDPTEFYNIGSEITERYIWGRVENYKHLLEEPRDVIIWRKNNFGMGKGYRGQYECCFYYGDFNGSDSDVWDVARDYNYVHPTQKPIDLCLRAIKNSEPKIVIDYFLGSGSTLIACEKTNRKCYGMELDEKYCDVIIKRYMEYTKRDDVILESTGEKYNDLIPTEV